MCQSYVIGSQFLEEQTSQVPLPYYNPRVFKLDLDDDTSFVMNWLADEFKNKKNCFLGWPYILESTDELRRLLGNLFREMGQYIYDYFNYNAMRWIKKDAAIPSATLISNILLDEMCRRIAQAYNYMHMRAPHICSREDCSTPLMDTGGLVSDDYFKSILIVSPDYNIIENTFVGGWPTDTKKGTAQINFNIKLRPDTRLGTLGPIHLVVMTLKYPVEYHGNPNE